MTIKAENWSKVNNFKDRAESWHIGFPWLKRVLRGGERKLGADLKHIGMSNVKEEKNHSLNSAQLNSTPAQHFFFAAPASTQRQLHSNATRHQGRVSSTQLSSARAKRAPRASYCEQHLLTKMRLAVSFYYLVTMMCRFKVLCLLTRQTTTGIGGRRKKVLLHSN